MSLLTGAPRSATVRALEGALVYEIGRRQYAPILAARPELVEALERAMEARLEAQGRCSSATTPSAPARASRAGSGGCWRAPELAEELQRVGARGVRAERADLARDRLGEDVGLRQPDAVLGRDDDRGGEAGEREVRGREAVAAQVAAAVRQALGDGVEGGEDERRVVGGR